MVKHEVQEDNYKLFALLSRYLNEASDLIKKDEVDDLVQYGVSKEYAFAVILAATFGLDIVENRKDKEFFNQYFKNMFHQLNKNQYENNPYYKNIRVPAVKIGNCELKYETYMPYEGFVCDDIIQNSEGRQIPQIGFFDEEFEYPAILENNRIWMTITPNEIETMKEAVERAHGHVLTFGLGMGYYAYMVSEKEAVDSVTVVEINDDVIQLFNQYILPQFSNRKKIKVIKADAFEFAKNHMNPGTFDFVFTDLWHDVSDGIQLYLKMKEYEKQSPQTQFMYWIEKSILCYL